MERLLNVNNNGLLEENIFFRNIEDPSGNSLNLTVKRQHEMTFSIFHSLGCLLSATITLIKTSILNWNVGDEISTMMLILKMQLVILSIKGYKKKFGKIETNTKFDFSKTILRIFPLQMFPSFVCHSNVCCYFCFALRSHCFHSIRRPLNVFLHNNRKSGENFSFV